MTHLQTIKHLWLIILILLNFTIAKSYIFSTSKCIPCSTANTTQTLCKYKYNTRTKTSTEEYCKIPDIKIKEVQLGKWWDRYYYVNTTGFVIDKFYVDIDVYGCKFSVFNPTTWFGCKEEYLYTDTVSVSLFKNMEGYVDNIYRNPVAYTKSVDQFSFLFELGYGLTKDTDIKLAYDYSFYISDYKIYKKESNTHSLREYISEEEIETIEREDKGSSTDKPFIFPFKKIIYVTQWHGHTDYDNDHTGIDFGAYKENTLAIGDGIVEAVGWDSFYPGCSSSGGNYITVKQDNGMYTVYFHLDSMNVDAGDRVTKGQTIAVSGNSGYWNCQPLGYHLHLETRLQRSQYTHVNPVDYIDTDWNLVLTSGWQTYPGRLTGDNPHPGS